MNGIPFLKERLLGLTGAEGNHGGDAKEQHFNVDNTPNHSYMKHHYTTVMYIGERSCNNLTFS